MTSEVGLMVLLLDNEAVVMATMRRPLNIVDLSSLPLTEALRLMMDSVDSISSRRATFHSYAE